MPIGSVNYVAIKYDRTLTLFLRKPPVCNALKIELVQSILYFYYTFLEMLIFFAPNVAIVKTISCAGNWLTGR